MVHPWRWNEASVQGCRVCGKKIPPARSAQGRGTCSLECGRNRNAIYRQMREEGKRGRNRYDPREDPRFGRLDDFGPERSCEES